MVSELKSKIKKSMFEDFYTFSATEIDSGGLPDVISGIINNKLPKLGAKTVGNETVANMIGENVAQKTIGYARQ